MIDIILAIALSLGTLSGPVVQGPSGPAGGIPMPPSAGISAQ
jgi:hypothetical protein